MQKGLKPKKKRLANNEPLKNGEIQLTKAMPNRELTVDEKYCKGCGVCAAFCPCTVLEVKNEKVRIANPDKCIGCRLCEKLCPDYAIYFSDEKGGTNQ